MSSDDDFVTRLNQAVGDGPPVRVTPQRVLAGGRRRRLARITGASLGVTVLVAGGAVGVVTALPDQQAVPPAGAPPASEPVPQRPMPTSTDPAQWRSDLVDVDEVAPPTDEPVEPVRFDPATGTVTEPLDAYRLSDQQVAVVRTAADHQAAACLGESDPTWADIADQITVAVVPPAGFETYGLWTDPGDGTEYAYPYPGAAYPDDLELPDGAGPSFTASQDPACAAVAEYSGDNGFDGGTVFRLEGTVTDNDGDEAWPVDVAYTVQGQAVLQDWATCVRAAGIADGSDGGPVLAPIPRSSVGASPGQRERTAAVDLTCKDELGTTQALADLQARTQGAYIDRYRDQLTALHTDQLATYDQAATYLRDQGVTVPEG